MLTRYQRRAQLEMGMGKAHVLVMAFMAEIQLLQGNECKSLRDKLRRDLEETLEIEHQLIIEHEKMCAE